LVAFFLLGQQLAGPLLHLWIDDFHAFILHLSELLNGILEAVVESGTHHFVFLLHAQSVVLDLLIVGDHIAAHQVKVFGQLRRVDTFEWQTLGLNCHHLII